MKKVCPECGHDRFVTTGVEYHDWIVDGNGYWVDTLGCFGSQVGETEWQCRKCEAVFSGSDELKEIEE